MSTRERRAVCCCTRLAVVLITGVLLAGCSEDNNPPPPTATPLPHASPTRPQASPTLAPPSVTPIRPATPTQAATPTLSPRPRPTDFRVVGRAELVETTNPQLPVWFYITSGLSQNGLTPHVLTVANNSYSPGTAVTLAELVTPQAGQALATGQLWQAQGGTLRSGIGNDLVLSYLPSAPGTAMTSLIDPAGGAIQHWHYDADTMQISNSFNPGNLYVVGDSVDSSSVAFGYNSDMEGATWYPWPSYPLRNILALQQTGFPSFSGAEAAAYDCINDAQHLNLTGTCVLGGGSTDFGVRCQYVNLVATLSAYQDDISNYDVTSCQGYGVDATSFSNVKGMLNNELTAAQAVQKLYAEYDEFVNTVFIENSAQLQQLILDSAIDTSSNVTAVAGAVIEGVVYTALSALGTAAGVVGNLMETAISATEAAQPGVLSSPFTAAVDQLYTELASRFSTILTVLNTQEGTILSNWDMMQQVAMLSAQTSTPDALGFDPAQKTALLNAAAAGYAVATMQVLLPVKYALNRYLGQASGTGLSGPPSYDQWVESLGAGLYNKFSIGDNSGYPSQTAIQTDVFDNGATQHDFFYGTNGWEEFNATLYSNINCSGQLVTITNYTANGLSVTVTPTAGYLGGNGVNLQIGEGTQSPVIQSLPPYGFVQFAGTVEGTSGDLDFDVQVFDATSSPAAPVVSWPVGQTKEGGGNCPLPTVGTISSANGYTGTVLQIVQSQQFGPGVAALGVYFALTPQPTLTATPGPSHTPTPRPSSTSAPTLTPTLRPTATPAGPANCCQCSGPFAGCFGAAESCGDCMLVVNATCDDATGQCVSFTPTPTHVAENVIYVSASKGSDGYPGTQLNPKQSIQAGINAAHSAGATGVCIDGGTYHESLTLASGVTIAGGFNSTSGWINDGSTTTLNGIANAPAVMGSNTNNLSIRDLDINAADTTTVGSSSYGILLNNAAGITISGCTVKAGAGNVGSAGAPGQGGASGHNGSSGATACENGGGVGVSCDTCNRPLGGAAGAASFCQVNAQGISAAAGSGGGGGNAGDCTGDNQDSDPGATGGSAASPGGGGGGSGGSGVACKAGANNGTTGGRGEDGLNGAAGSHFGTAAGQYSPAAGQDGEFGQPGGGGGGGSGGGGGNHDCDSYGGGGGGGGAGGCGGFLGGGGGGGGGSFAIWVFASAADAVSIVNTHLASGPGGDGGPGGSGGTAGSGGTGGQGGSNAGDDETAGGTGGSGGAGGHGSHGGGGGGGPSIAIVCSGATVTCTGLTFDTSHAAGGHGGTSEGNPGSTGLQANANGCPNSCSTPAALTPTPTSTRTATSTATPTVYWVQNGQRTSQVTVPLGGMNFGNLETLMLVDSGGRLCSTTNKARLEVNFNTLPLSVEQYVDTRTTEALIKHIPGAGLPGAYDLLIQTYDCATGVPGELITMRNAITYPTPALQWVLDGTPVPPGTPVQVPLGGKTFAQSCSTCPGTLVLQDTGARLCMTANKATLEVNLGALEPHVTQYPDTAATEVLVQTIPAAATAGTYDLEITTYVCDSGDVVAMVTMQNAIEYVAPTATPTIPTATPTRTAAATNTAIPQTPTRTPTAIPTATRTATRTNTPTQTHTPTATRTGTPTATLTHTRSATTTPTATDTPVRPTDTPTAVPPTTTPTMSAGDFSWLIDATPAAQVTGLSTQSPTTYQAPPGSRTLALVDSQGRFCYQAGLQTVLVVGDPTTGPVVGIFPDPTSSAGTLYVASLPAAAQAMTYALSIETYSEPNCQGSPVTLTFPQALVYVAP